MHPEKRGKKSFDREHFEKKFTRASALAGDEKRSPSFSAASSPIFFHITGQKSKRKKKDSGAESMEMTWLREDPESKPLLSLWKGDLRSESVKPQTLNPL